MKGKKNKGRIKIKTKLAVLFAVLLMVMTMTPAGSTDVFADSLSVGKLAASYKVTGDISPAAVSGDYVYFTSVQANGDSTLHRVDKSNLGNHQSVALPKIKYNIVAPTVGGDNVFVALDDGKIAVVKTDMSGAAVTVTYDDQKGQTVTPITYDNGTLYVGSFQDNESDGEGGVYAKITTGAAGDYSADKVTVTEIVSSATGFYWAGACVDGSNVIFGSVSNGNDGDLTPADGDAKLYLYNGSEIKALALTGAGSICSTVVKKDSKYYFTSKAGKLYEAEINNGALQKSNEFALKYASTCTPLLSADGTKAYVGSGTSGEGVVEEVSLSAWGWYSTPYYTPADVKSLVQYNGRIYCTYNGLPGGIYDAAAGQNYFSPDADKQDYCLSNIVVDGGSLYYTNDSDYLMKIDAATTTHKITAAAGIGGAVSPAETIVNDGGSYTLHLDPAEGYEVNAVSGGGTLSADKSRYTLADITEDKTINVTFKKVGAAANKKIEVSAQYQNEFLIPHKTLSVSSALAESYGYKDTVAANKVSALDALVAAHIYYYDTKNKGTINEKLVVSQQGWVGTAFEKSSPSAGYNVNEETPMDSINQKAVEKGARVDFYYYEETYPSSDITGIFTDGTNKMLKKTVKPKESFDIYTNQVSWDGSSGALANVQLALVDADKAVKAPNTLAAKPIKDKGNNVIITGEDGKAVLSFDKAGTYYVTALERADGTNVIMPWLTVTVSETPADTAADTKTSQSTKTGDDSNMMIFVIIAALAIAAAATIIIISRKRKDAK